jgi:hypothetical protein
MVKNEKRTLLNRADPRNKQMNIVAHRLDKGTANVEIDNSRKAVPFSQQASVWNQK